MDQSGQRRTSRGGPGGSRRPGARTPRTSAPRGRAPAKDETVTELNPVVTTSTGSTGPLRATGSTGSMGALRVEERGPRFTGRAAVLVLVVAVLTVSYGSSLKAFLQQRSHIAELKEQIAEREASIRALEREKRRWSDPAFVAQEGHRRFGYVMPGETSYVVLDADGQPLESGATLHDPDEVVKEEPTAWWTSAWASVELAGNPPVEKNGAGKPPASEIDGTQE
jgi:cell division protein FtsB